MCHIFFPPHSIVAWVVALLRYAFRLMHFLLPFLFKCKKHICWSLSCLLFQRQKVTGCRSAPRLLKLLSWTRQYPLFFLHPFLDYPTGDPLSWQWQKPGKEAEKKISNSTTLRKTSKNPQDGSCSTAPKQGPILTPLPD